MARSIRRSLPPAVGPHLALLLALVLADGAAAATFNVTSLADSGPGSLRQAVLDANAAAGADTIVFAVNGTIPLTSGEMAITGDLTVNGPGPGALTVSGNDQSRIFNVDNGAAGVIDVLLSGLTLTHGYAKGPGGAVVSAENLTVLGSVISDSVSEGTSALAPARGGNLAQMGGTLRIANSSLIGGVAADGSGDGQGGNLFGSPLLERSVISGGSADYGGGISGYGRIYTSTISGNSARIYGGGVYGFQTIDSSTVWGNTSQFNGGGLALSYGMTGFILNSTISGNDAVYMGGGIFLEGGGDGAPSPSLYVRHSTFSNNTAEQAGGNLGFYIIGGAYLELNHSIFANGAPNDIEPDAGLVEYSLIENTTGLFIEGSHNILGVDPLLGPLADNGGPTLTHALLPGSPAIDAGNPAIPSPPATDQRGFARIFGPAVDLGSVEAQPLGLVDVPTFSQTGALLLALLLVATGLWKLRLTRSAG